MKQKILIVEDEKEIIDVLETKLSKNGFNVITANDGREGLEKALINHPDVILLDIVMPKMDGLTMLGELRKDKWGKKARVIVLTNLSYDEKVKDISKYGFNGYLIKSEYRLEDVIKKVKFVLKDVERKAEL